MSMFHMCCCACARFVCAQVLTLAGELLGNAEVLLRDGLHTAEIADGYQRAADKVGRS
jgi:chaperonin GroEL (HSP60 family)